MSNFKKKANHFNAFFTFRCRPISNDSTLPLATTSVTNASLSSVSFKYQFILRIIHFLSVDKTNGYNVISTRVLNICDS